MHSIAVSVVALATAAWVGAILFQSAVVAPSIFAHLDAPSAGALLRGLFPRFFRFGLYCGLLMLAGIVVLGVVHRWHPPLFSLAATVSFMIALQVYSLRLVPAINAARDSGESGARRFARLHMLSVALTIANLLLGMAIVAVLAAGPRLGGST